MKIPNYDVEVDEYEMKIPNYDVEVDEYEMEIPNYDVEVDEYEEARTVYRLACRILLRKKYVVN